MELSERKQKILKAVVDDYITFAEPVGSTHIAKNHHPELSSATIRNELADLEELGYLVKTHTSSGRVPSELGYRTYVNSLMKKYMVSMEEVARLKSEMEHKIKELDYYIKEVLNIAAGSTNLTAIATSPDFSGGTLKRIELMMLDSFNILLILVTETDTVKSRPIKLKSPVDFDFITNLKSVLNSQLAGLTLDKITKQNFEVITEQLGGNYEAVANILEFVYSTINEMNENEIYLSGETNLLGLPEFKDISKAKKFLELIHDEKKIREILKNNSKGNVLNVVIGNEQDNEDLDQLSLVVTTYKISDNVTGVMGVIGPNRMDYSKVISSLEYLSENINTLALKAPENENNEVNSNG